MKHLKKYNELIINGNSYKLPKNVVNEIRDILLELEDLKFTTVL